MVALIVVTDDVVAESVITVVTGDDVVAGWMFVAKEIMSNNVTRTVFEIEAGIITHSKLVNNIY